MLNVAELLDDFDFIQQFTVYRKATTKQRGNVSSTETPLTFSGVITPAGSTELEQIPEGDRQRGAITIYTQQELEISNTAGTSDEVLWQGNRYRVQQVFAYANYGYWKAIAVKMDPSTEVWA